MPQTLFCLGGYELNRYQTYPHSNGFTVDGREMVIVQMMPDHTSLWMLPIDRLDIQPQTISPGRRIASFDLPQPVSDKPPITVWPDIALHKNVLTLAVQDTVWLLDLTESPVRPQILYVAPKGWKLTDLTSLKPDGSAVCFGVRAEEAGIYQGLEVDTATGHVTTVIQTNWYVNHFHYCPHDPDWLGYCHEGPTEQIPDRMHAMHPTHLPKGQCIFDQQSDEPGKLLCVGHERWCYHEAAAITIAYGVSPAGPRGLYHINPHADQPARLISEGDRDWHCNVTRDGKHMVVDTTGPSDEPGSGWHNAKGVSDVLHVNPQTGYRTLLARTRHRMQPWHPHPTFSPDGRWVFFNDYNGNDDNPRGRVGCVPVAQ
tara:strand:+ start:381 stop:1493 length:1113 start_codon:yes stop_codon:yes gene_type:complete